MPLGGRQTVAARAVRAKATLAPAECLRLNGRTLSGGDDNLNRPRRSRGTRLLRQAKTISTSSRRPDVGKAAARPGRATRRFRPAARRPRAVRSPAAGSGNPSALPGPRQPNGVGPAVLARIQPRRRRRRPGSGHVVVLPINRAGGKGLLPYNGSGFLFGQSRQPPLAEPMLSGATCPWAGGAAVRPRGSSGPGVTLPVDDRYPPRPRARWDDVAGLKRVRCTSKITGPAPHPAYNGPQGLHTSPRSWHAGGASPAVLLRRVCRAPPGSRSRAGSLQGAPIHHHDAAGADAGAVPGITTGRAFSHWLAPRTGLRCVSGRAHAPFREPRGSDAPTQT